MPEGRTKAKSRYRPEIDGLRAFAVVAVIINHFKKDLLPSGYLGVDIFFVISGYVITSSLAGRESKNFLDFLTGFYERRIKRLVPALVVFVLITSVLISFFNPDPGVALGLGWRSLFGISNINLYRSSTDYFAQSTELNPFTHTWSLGVEEQFYLLFPFLIWFSGFGQQIANGARNLFLWVGALTIASLFGFIYLYQVNQPAAYFLMPPRFWEMATGCLLFIGFQKRANIEQVLERIPPLLVVTAMVAVMFLPVSAAVPATIGIVMLSTVLIACLKPGTAAYNFFTIEKVVYVGLISYSLYLWHWSVLSISRWTVGIHWWSVPFQVGLMMLMAICSYNLIETPVRKEIYFHTRWKTVFSGICILTATVIAVVGFSRAKVSQNLYLGVKTDSKSEWGRLGNFRSKCLSLFAECLHLNDPKERQVFFWIGDSHTAHLLPIAERMSEEFLVDFASYQSGGDAHQPFPVLVLERKGRSPSEYSKEGLNLSIAYSQALNSLKSGDVIIISVNLPMYFSGTGGRLGQFSYFDGDGKRVSTKTAFEIWLKELTYLTKFAESKDISVVVVLPIPQFQDYKGIATCSDQPFRLFEMQGCKLQREKSSIYGKWHGIASGLRKVAKSMDNLFMFDPSGRFCSQDGMCKNYSQQHLLYMDGNHLRKEGALWLYSDFTDFLKESSLLR